jgi:ribosome-associated toxin RatA of RatAB toxin-antitoxin module
MPTISRSALVMHSTEEMYTLINDVLSYPKFLPNCCDSKIISQDDNKMIASLLVAKGGIKKWFTTENTLLANETVLMKLRDGPFKKLEGCWTLAALSEDACKISLSLDYEFSNKVLALAFGKIFNNLANNMVQAFIQQANKVYGKNV